MTSTEEALLHLKNAVLWLSTAAVYDPLLHDQASRLETEALNLEKYINEKRPPEVVGLPTQFRVSGALSGCLIAR